MKIRRSIVKMGLVASFALPVPVAILAQEDVTIEEIVVTGSYIRRDSFDSASPVTIVTSEDILANATPNLGEVLQAQTFNYGTDFQTNTYAARSQGGNNSQANLRGLGASATLDLLDGRRTATGNLNSSLPQIAIQRIEILKDGASAIYGTDAVAGVVNIITNKTFEGAKINLFSQQDEGGDIREEQIELMVGTATDNGHFTLALSWSERGELQQVERPDFLRNGFERSGTGNPGDWNVPNRDASGVLTGTASRLVDPGCGVENHVGGTDVGSALNFVSGDPNGSGTNCRLHFGKAWNFMNPQEKISLWSNWTYEINDNITNELSLVATRLDTESRGSPQNPGGRTEEFPIVLGTHPGNPFRAMADRGNGQEPLYAQDANGDGIPDRGTADLNNDGVFDVLLASDPFAASSGIPFNEDVDVVALRILGFLGTLPGVNNPDAIDPKDGSNTGNATFDSTNYRLSNTLTVAIPDTSWEVSGNFIFQENLVYSDQKNSSQSNLILGLNGELKADPTDAATTYWNPFSTQAFNCTDRNCSFSGTPDFANTVPVLNAINIRAVNVTESTFINAEVIATGDIYEMPDGGVIAGAFGYQFRRNKIDVDVNSAENRCDWHQGGCGFDWSAKQDVDSAFFELLVPFSGDTIGELEFTIAGRYSDYGGSIGDSFDPKISLLWQPTDMLSIRASYSTAFIAPSLNALFSPENCGLQTANDPLTQDFSQSFRVACNSGNPDLVPETADVFNVGVSLSLLDGDLNLGLDYSVFDFEDRITSTTLNQIVTRDFDNFLAQGGDVNNPASVQAWINGAADPRISRDVTGVMTRVITNRLNAQSMKHKAYDVYARYNLDLETYGSFRFNLDATYVDEYSFDLGFGIPPGEAAGSQNESIANIPPIPEWRVTGTANWSRGNHSAMIRTRWTDGFDLAFNSSGLQSAQIAINGTDEMDDITYLDVNYRYTFDGLIGDGTTTLEVGGRNILDEFPDPIFNLGGIETFVHDIRGATYYFRINQQF